MSEHIPKLPSALQIPADPAGTVPRSGHADDRDLGASLAQVLKAQATPIPGAEEAREDLDYRRRLIAHIRTQDALLLNAAVRGSTEGVVVGGLLQLGWSLFRSRRAEP